MYRKKSRGWYKHKDFILIDLICLFLSLLIAHLIRNGSVQSLFRVGIYRNMISFVILADLFLIIIFESYKGVLRRGYYHNVINFSKKAEIVSIYKTMIPAFCFLIWAYLSPSFCTRIF